MKNFAVPLHSSNINFVSLRIKLEVNINNKSTEELEAELVATLSKYMGHAIPVTDGKDPLLGVDLDEELGRV